MRLRPRGAGGATRCRIGRGAACGAVPGRRGGIGAGVGVAVQAEGRVQPVVQVAPLRVKALGAVLVPDQLPLKPNDTEPPAPIVAL